MSRMTTKPWTPSSGNITFVRVGERWFCAYLTDVLGPLKDSYIGRYFKNGHIDLRGVPIESYEGREEAAYGREVVGTTERRKCVKDYCYVNSVHVQM